MTITTAAAAPPMWRPKAVAAAGIGLALAAADLLLDREHRPRRDNPPSDHLHDPADPRAPPGPAGKLALASAAAHFALFVVQSICLVAVALSSCGRYLRR